LGGGKGGRTCDAHEFPQELEHLEVFGSVGGRFQDELVSILAHADGLHGLLSVRARHEQRQHLLLFLLRLAT
jgi:hypothetical protein